MNKTKAAIRKPFTGHEKSKAKLQCPKTAIQVEAFDLMTRVTDLDH